MNTTNQLLPFVKEILFREWDPIGVNSIESCRDEYDSYAPEICGMLTKGIDHFHLTAHLGKLQQLSMGISRIDEELNSRIAVRLLSLMENRK
jgi:hypothetical protein